MEPHNLDYTNERAVRRHIEACMETGNHVQARTVVKELAEFNFPLASNIRATVARDYGTDL